MDIILRDEHGMILLETRKYEPFKNCYSLPGGHVDYGETVEESVLRELTEECSVEGRLIAILGVYSNPSRDPRGQRITTVFIADYASGKLRAKDDAKSASWVTLDQAMTLSLAFDHVLILKHYKSWLEGGGTYWSGKVS